MRRMKSKQRLTWFDIQWLVYSSSKLPDLRGKDENVEYSMFSKKKRWN